MVDTDDDGPPLHVEGVQQQMLDVVCPSQGFIIRPVAPNRRPPVPANQTGLTGYRSEPDKRKFEFKFPR